MDPRSWQRSLPLLERESDAGRSCFVVTKSEYARTGFTDAILRGGTFFGADEIGARIDIAADLAARHAGALIYLYIPELDGLGHRHGWESDAWAGGLEQVDAAARRLSNALTPGTGMLLTADHGMVDVPRHKHLLLESGDTLTEGVRLIGGEPRMLHIYAEPGRQGDVLTAWREAESGRSWVLSRAEAVAAGLFGNVHDDVLPRLGDVLVAARADVAYYDDRLTDKGAQKMVGQHGSLTSQERIVPLLRFGAFA